MRVEWRVWCVSSNYRPSGRQLPSRVITAGECKDCCKLDNADNGCEQINNAFRPAKNNRQMDRNNQITGRESVFVATVLSLGLSLLVAVITAFPASCIRIIVNLETRLLNLASQQRPTSRFCPLSLNRQNLEVGLCCEAKLMATFRLTYPTPKRTLWKFRSLELVTWAAQVALLQVGNNKMFDA